MQHQQKGKQNSLKARFENEKSFFFKKEKKNVIYPLQKKA